MHHPCWFGEMHRPGGFPMTNWTERGIKDAAWRQWRTEWRKVGSNPRWAARRPYLVRSSLCLLVPPTTLPQPQFAQFLGQLHIQRFKINVKVFSLKYLLSWVDAKEWRLRDSEKARPKGSATDSREILDAQEAV